MTRSEADREKMSPMMKQYMESILKGILVQLVMLNINFLK